MHKMTTTETKKIKDVIATVNGPKRSTVNFLKQFARAYSYNEELPRGLESMILN